MRFSRLPLLSLLAIFACCAPCFARQTQGQCDAAAAKAYQYCLKNGPPCPPGKTCGGSTPAQNQAACMRAYQQSLAACAQYTIGGAVYGLNGGSMVLEDNGGSALTVTGNGAFRFALPLGTHAAYAVSVSQQPSGQQCIVLRGSGTVANGNVTNVAVTCGAAQQTIGQCQANASTALQSCLKNGLPCVPGKTCGKTPAAECQANFQRALSNCSTIYTVGGTVYGLNAGTLVLQDNAGMPLPIIASGAFTFNVDLASNETYNVTIEQQPANQICYLQNALGTVSGANVSSVTVTCGASGNVFTVGGTVSGFGSGILVLQDNGGSPGVSISGNGAFAFASRLGNNATYSVTVKQQPFEELCVVSNGSGSVNNANVTNVAVQCGIVGPKPLVAKASVLTQRYNNQRTGANTQEPVLNAQNVASTAFQKLFEVDVDGQVYAQPLVVSNVYIPSQNAVDDILVVATMNNTISAFAVDNGLPGTSPFAPVLLWAQNFGTSVPANFMPMAGTADTCLFFGNLCLPNGNHDTPDAPVATLPPINNCCPPNFNINPAIGILSTPVALTSQGVPGGAITGGAIYGEAEVMGAGSNVEHHLFSVDLITGVVKNNTVISGAVAATSPDSVNGTLTFNSNQEMQRPGLLADPATNVLYVAFGSHQDTRPWHGWVFQFFADPQGDLAPPGAGAGPTAIWTSTPSAMGGAIWQGGSGLTEDDSNGNVYAMTGNGEDNTEGQDSTDQSTSGINFADMFVELSPGLPAGVAASFAPSDESNREKDDLDLGSSGPVKMPGKNILVGGDKEGLIFVLDTTSSLGMRQTFQASKPLDVFSVSGSGFHHIHGTPVLWRNSSNVLTLYVWAERDNLRTFSWDDTNAVFDCLNSSNQIGQCPLNNGKPVQMSSLEDPDCAAGTLGCSKMPGGILSLSANGSTAGSGVVWASMPTDTDALQRVVPGVLRAFNAENVATELWDSNLNPARDGGFNFAKFSPPVVANGRVYLATFGNSAGAAGSVNIYGLFQATAQPQANMKPAAVKGQWTCTGASPCQCTPKSAKCLPLACPPGQRKSGAACVAIRPQAR